MIDKKLNHFEYETSEQNKAKIIKTQQMNNQDNNGKISHTAQFRNISENKQNHQKITKSKTKISNTISAFKTTTSNS